MLPAQLEDVLACHRVGTLLNRLGARLLVLSEVLWAVGVVECPPTAAVIDSCVLLWREELQTTIQRNDIQRSTTAIPGEDHLHQCLQRSARRHERPVPLAVVQAM